MSQKCYNFVAKFINNTNMEEKKSDLIEGLKEYLDNASEKELAELEKYNQFGPVVDVSKEKLIMAEQEKKGGNNE